MRRSFLLPVLAASVLAMPARAQTPAERLADDIAAHNELAGNLEELCDGIGPRLTGTPRLAAARDWAARKLVGYHAADVREEPYQLARSWRRGPAEAHLLNAGGQPLHVLQLAWTRGTDGPVRAEAVYIKPGNWDQWRQAAPTLRGKIVVVDGLPRATDEQRKDLAAYLRLARANVTAAGAAAILNVSHKDENLGDMWGGPDALLTERAGIISRQGANLLKRLAARGAHPQVELDLRSTFGPATQEANVVAEVPGATREVVLLGAHLDSWDLASGATDNGAGVAVMLEALRAIRALGIQPRRTLRLVLFTGEEEGLLGSRAYVDAHRAELDQVRAVLVQDAGAGRIMGFPDMRDEAWYGALTAALEPLQKRLGPLDVMFDDVRGSDEDSFLRAGVPAFAALQEPLNYEHHTQHSEADVVEQVPVANLVHNAQVIAALAWALLNAETLPGHSRAGGNP
ncbi:MAG: M20/M25/M40 family metallo-hydrolase [Telluria sp.]